MAKIDQITHTVDSSSSEKGNLPSVDKSALMAAKALAVVHEMIDTNDQGLSIEDDFTQLQDKLAEIGYTVSNYKSMFGGIYDLTLEQDFPNADSRIFPNLSSQPVSAMSTALTRLHEYFEIQSMNMPDRYSAALEEFKKISVFGYHAMNSALGKGGFEFIHDRDPNTIYLSIVGKKERIFIAETGTSDEFPIADVYQKTFDILSKNAEELRSK